MLRQSINHLQRRCSKNDESTEQKEVAVSGGDIGKSASGEDFGINGVSGGDIDNGAAGSGAGESGKPDGKDKGKVEELVSVFVTDSCFCFAIRILFFASLMFLTRVRGTSAKSRSANDTHED